MNARPALPSAKRPLGVAAAAAGGLTITTALPLPSPPATAATDPAALIGWWDHVGTATAAVGVLRLAAIAAWAWLAAVAVVTVVLGVAATANRLPGWVVPRHLRPLLIASAVTTMAAPTPAGAIDADPVVPALVDLGPAPEIDPEPAAEPAPMLRDLGPTPITEPAPAADRHDVWTVEPGDHLWHIAEETLRDHGLDPTEQDVARYWRDVIATNESAVGENPDLILPGQTIVLPPVQGL